MPSTTHATTPTLVPKTVFKRMLSVLSHTVQGWMYAAFRFVLRNNPVSVPFVADSVRKILIMRYDKIGDMIVTMPALTLLCEHLPHAELHVLASPRNAGLLAHDARCAKTFLWDGSLKALPQLARQIRHEKYDVALCYVFFKMTNTGLLANLLVGANVRKVTLSHDDPRRAARYATFFNTLVAIPTEQPMAQLLAEMTSRVFGFRWESSAITRLFHIATTEQHIASADAWFKELAFVIQKRRVLLLNLSAGMPFRQWSFTRNSEFLRGVQALHPNFFIIVNATETEREQAEALCARYALSPANVVVMPPASDVLAVVAFVKHVDIVVTPDTAITHIATACGKPSVVLCTSISSSEQWMPVAVPYRSVYAPEGEAIEAIAPERVLAAFGELVSEVWGGS